MADSSHLSSASLAKQKGFTKTGWDLPPMLVGGGSVPRDAILTWASTTLVFLSLREGGRQSALWPNPPPGVPSSTFVPPNQQGANRGLVQGSVSMLDLRFCQQNGYIRV